jgi:probable phosphoglycerate mutase
VATIAHISEVRPQAAPARVYLVRHGRTLLNASGALRGRIDVPLDPVGLGQAEALAAALTAAQPQVIVSSPLCRAVQTVQPLADALGLGIIIDDRLVDRDYGEWAGVSARGVAEQWGSLDAAPGVEPASEVRDRVLAALSDIAKGVPGAAAVVASHDIVIRTALAALAPRLGAPDSVPQETGCFNVLAYRDAPSALDGAARWVVDSVNQVPPPVC